MGNKTSYPNPMGTDEDINEIKSIEPYRKLSNQKLTPIVPSISYNPEEIEQYLLTATKEEAEKKCEPFLATHGHACYSLGNYFCKNNLAGGSKYYVMGTNLNDAKCHKTLAIMYQNGILNTTIDSEKKQQRKQAIIHYQKYLAKEKDINCYMELGNLLYDTDKYINMAIEYYEKYLAGMKFLENKSGNPYSEITKKLGRCYERKNPKKALEFYNELYKRGATEVVSNVLQVILAIDYIEYGEVHDWLEIAIDIDLKDSKYIISQIFRKIGSYKKAKELCLVAEREYHDLGMMEDVKKCQNLLAYLILDAGSEI